MSRYDMKVPDVGEGVAEAELVEWLVQVGDQVTPDTVIAEVLTDKATVEISAPVTGEVVALHGEPGDLLAVGGELIGIETEQVVEDAPPPAPTEQSAEQAPAEPQPQAEASEIPPPPRAPQPPGQHPTAAPAVRNRAKELGLDLAQVQGTGPEGRILHEDLDRAVGGGPDAIDLRAASSLRVAPAEGQSKPVRGVRRRISERLTDAWTTIPHITYVDDVDMTELERLRAELNLDSEQRGVRLTILPFLARAMVLAIADQPGTNAHYDHASEMLTTFEAVHIGIATQTEEGLRVPVVRHCEGRGIWGLATEIGRVTTAARDGSATRTDLTGSTISITSLGALGGIVTTPIINPPEVAIIGVNKMETRPVWQDGAFQPRKMMNLSSSFDHRMVDGWDAAIFIQKIKRLLETPALLFVTDE
ncbi:MAG: 2-oxo acid dehydrogenase subunit E2 [Acidimicrobiia bacterium]|nr:2-oxo acid dehydrogenase subunit E2 [Acidimicrobiia bacterium]